MLNGVKLMVQERKSPEQRAEEKARREEHDKRKKN